VLALAAPPSEALQQLLLVLDQIDVERAKVGTSTAFL